MNYDFLILLYVVGTSSVFEETTISYFVQDISDSQLSTLLWETESAPIKRRKHVKDKTRQDGLNMDGPWVKI